MMTNHELIRIELMEYMLNKANQLENEVRQRYNQAMNCKGDELDYFELILAMVRQSSFDSMSGDIYRILTRWRVVRLPRKRGRAPSD